MLPKAAAPATQLSWPVYAEESCVIPARFNLKRGRH
jgi:hypothetical protein